MSMKQAERREKLIRYLLDENPEYRDVEIPQEETGQRRLLRGLMNVRMPGAIDENFLRVQDEYLQEEAAAKGIVTIDDMAFNDEGLAVWKGDITSYLH